MQLLREYGDEPSTQDSPNILIRDNLQMHQLFDEQNLKQEIEDTDYKPVRKISIQMEVLYG